MKNSIKKILIIMMFVMALFMPLQLPAYSTSQTLNNDIAAITKEPMSKKKIAFKFIMAMVGVAASSVLIYVGLSVYNRIFKAEANNVVGLKNLRAPANFKESINVFLEKTKWD